MKSIKLAIAILFAVASARAQNFTTHVYKKTDSIDLKLDVYGASKGANKPVIILFHGGGFTGGDRSAFKDQCAYFAGKGLVAITASYRLVPKTVKGSKMEWIARCLKDTKSAVRWVKLHASEFGIDTNRVILGGGSAGGYLATNTQTNTTINDEADNLKVSTAGKAMVLFNPAYGDTEFYGPDPSPTVTPKSVPAIFFYGEKDQWITMGTKFYNTLAKAGVATELWVAPGQPHGFFNGAGWKEATQIKAAQFLKKLGYIKGDVNETADKTIVLQAVVK